MTLTPQRLPAVHAFGTPTLEGSPASESFSSASDLFKMKIAILQFAPELGATKRNMERASSILERTNMRDVRLAGAAGDGVHRYFKVKSHPVHASKLCLGICHVFCRHRPSSSHYQATTSIPLRKLHRTWRAPRGEDPQIGPWQQQETTIAMSRLATPR